MQSAVSELLESIEEHLRARREELCRSTEELLVSVEERLERHRKLRAPRNENFNVFRLLDVECSEEELHSPFIAELLDPHGSHDLGTTFLQLFLNEVGEQVGQAFEINAEDATVEREKDIGPVVTKGESSTGGRIDIFISDGKRHLSIENKIGAEEGDKQVTRYCNFRTPHHFVLYLTLNGRAADTDKANYRRISYSEHILPWLASCQRHTTDFPLLHETINQYMITVGGLAMDTNIRDAMKRHYKAAWAIRQEFNNLVSEEVAALVPDVRTEIEQQAPQRKWEARLAGGKSGGLILERKDEGDTEGWGDTQVWWQYDWIGVHLSPASPQQKVWSDDKVVRRKCPWLDRNPSKSEPHWGYVPKERFHSEGGIERLLNEAERSELAKEIAGKLVCLASYCDNKFRDEPA